MVQVLRGHRPDPCLAHGALSRVAGESSWDPVRGPLSPGGCLSLCTIPVFLATLPSKSRDPTQAQKGETENGEFKRKIKKNSANKRLSELSSAAVAQRSPSQSLVWQGLAVFGPESPRIGKTLTYSGIWQYIVDSVQKSCAVHISVSGGLLCRL